VDASSIGHDLCRGVALFQRTRPATGKTAAEYAAELAAGGSTFDVAAGADADAALAAIGEPAPGADGSADREMFDADAIASLATEAAGAGRAVLTGRRARGRGGQHDPVKQPRCDRHQHEPVQVVAGHGACVSRAAPGVDGEVRVQAPDEGQSGG
jgi:hypothetical protein